MTAPLKTIEGSPDIAATMRDTMLGRRAKAAARVLALASTAQKDRALAAMAAAIRADKPTILAANAEDVADGKAAGLTGSFLDRLALNDQRIESDGRGHRGRARPRPIRSARSPNPGPGRTA